MVNVISILWFIFTFMLITAILYHYLLKDKELKKRLSYYLDIEKKYNKKNKEKVKSENLKDFFRNFNELIRGGLKKIISGGNQQKLNQLLTAAGVSLKPEEYIVMRFFFSIVLGGVCYVVFKSKLFLIAGAVIGFFLPKIWLKGKRRKRVERFNDGLADAITTIISSLKSGYSFSQALKTVAEESESPMKDEVEVLLNELSYGITMEEGLNNLNKRMPSTDLELMIHAILIQRQIGGNLSIILEIIVDTIRERKKLERHIKTLTAQGRLSGKIIAGLPIIISLIMYMFNRTALIDFATNRYGQIAMAIGVVSCIMGFVIINKITKVEV